MLTRMATRLGIVVLLLALALAWIGAPFAAQAQPAQTPTATSSSTPEAQATQYPPCPPVEDVEGMAEAEAPTPEATETAEPTVIGTPSLTPTFDTRAEFAPPYLGIAAEDVADCGSRVIEIVSGSPADRAGFQLGDVIVAADGVARRNVSELRNYILSRTAGQRVVFVIKRAEQELTIKAVLGLRPRITPPTVTPSN